MMLTRWLKGGAAGSPRGDRDEGRFGSDESGRELTTSVAPLLLLSVAIAAVVFFVALEIG